MVMMNKMVMRIVIAMANVICCALFAAVATLSSNVQAAVSDTPTTTDNADLLDKANVAELFDIGSGIFAVILCTLSLIAYKNLKSRRMLLVSAAFGMFAIHAIVSRIDVFIPAIESSLLELIVSIISFVSLAFFFLAIVKRPKINERTRTSPEPS
jgi:hypothetical protein